MSRFPLHQFKFHSIKISIDNFIEIKLKNALETAEICIKSVSRDFLKSLKKPDLSGFCSFNGGGRKRRTVKANPFG
jgi:hypothetical protein